MFGVFIFTYEYPSKIKRVGRRKYPTFPNINLKKSFMYAPATPVTSNTDIKKNNARTKKTIAIIPCFV